MNKKGFTLVELILVIVIIGIISVITVPNIMEALSESRSKGGESVEKLLEQNLELYNTDHEDELWCARYKGVSCDSYNWGTIAKLDMNGNEGITIDKLYIANPDIDMGQCLLQSDNSLKITRNSDGTYVYEAEIVCSRDFDSFNDSDKIATEQQMTNDNIYYKTKATSVEHE